MAEKWRNLREKVAEFGQNRSGNFSQQKAKKKIKETSEFDLSFWYYLSKCLFSVLLCMPRWVIRLSAPLTMHTVNTK